VADGWIIPPKWDQFSNDYLTADGYVRLHCNAPHHRDAALHVLGEAKTPQQAKYNALSWGAQHLAESIVSAGGCAAQLLTKAQWQAHPQAKSVGKEPVVAWDNRHNAASNWQPGSVNSPLQGLKVLDLTRIIAGPVSTRFLASLGANVLRIDPPGWVEGANEIEMTVGKTCSELDLLRPLDCETFKDLLSSAHVLVHGYRKDALNRLGFGAECLAQLNPSLISVSLTAYGWTGPWSNRRGFDSLVQRSTGLAVERNGEVISLPYQVLDHATGYLMAAAVMEALRVQLVQNSVAYASLSLARQAQLLLDTGADAGNVEHASSFNRSQVAQVHGTREITSWGPGWRCPLPYHMEGISPGWRLPAHSLRSDAPQWACDK